MTDTWCLALITHSLQLAWCHLTWIKLPGKLESFSIIYNVKYILERGFVVFVCKEEVILPLGPLGSLGIAIISICLSVCSSILLVNALSHQCIGGERWYVTSLCGKKNYWTGVTWQFFLFCFGENGKNIFSGFQCIISSMHRWQKLICHLLMPLVVA